ncbi:hypothetical protein GLOIN_2v1511284 [Rhizophagus clarus]|uniref:RING-type domain-containing protein n=1 Tax=Rhizophagus clarus TaxID=94130 RepID=A0A8H3QQS9_9GLOM|nr:hypothetical protein GLOIN_2v1511284 [Rhizophagus clarus]
MENQASLVNTEAITTDEINTDTISNTQNIDIYEVQPGRNKALKLLALYILKHLPDDILREELDVSSIKSNEAIPDYGPYGTLLCSCGKADHSDPLLPFQYSIVDYGGRKKSSIPESERPSLVNLRNLGYNILKSLEDKTVRDIDFPELGSCSECGNDILMFPLKAFSYLSCGHIFHRLCIENRLFLGTPSACPASDCGKSVDILDEAGIISNPDPRVISQSSGISPSMGTFALSSPPIQMLSSNRPQPQGPSKPLVYLTCKHIVHYNCIDNSRKLCPICPSTDMEPEEMEIDDDNMLLTNIPDSGEEEANAPDVSSNTGAPSQMKFLYLSDMIDQAETKNEDATRNVINRYFDFGEALYLRYKELKPSGGKDRAKALVKEEVRKQISETKFSDDALRKKMERAGKVYKLFNSIGRTKIAQIRSFPARSILNMSDSNVDHVFAGVLRAERS